MVAYASHETRRDGGRKGERAGEVGRLPATRPPSIRQERTRTSTNRLTGSSDAGRQGHRHARTPSAVPRWDADRSTNWSPWGLVTSSLTCRWLAPPTMTGTAPATVPALAQLDPSLVGLLDQADTRPTPPNRELSRSELASPPPPPPEPHPLGFTRNRECWQAVLYGTGSGR